MECDNARAHPNLIYFLIISACLNLLFMLFILFVLCDLNNIKKSIFNDEIIASIITSQEDQEFIRQICEELGINNDVVVVVGPYYVHSFFSETQNYHLNRLLSKYPIVVDPEDPARRILMKESTYAELTAEERRAVLAHELWHIYAFIKNGRIPALNLDNEIDANRFAAKRTKPDVLINLYRRYGDGSAEINTLINALRRQG